jgi:hypothetical protein
MLKQQFLAVLCGIAFCVSGFAEGQSSSATAQSPMAPVNPYNGMQEREDVFEFAQKPEVRVQGSGEKKIWVITFAVKGLCDATVTIVDKDRKVVRRLASGVLGKNAPWPFQQNSLSQKLEWDGQTDDFKNAPDGCMVKVGLGLKAVFERHMLYDHCDLPNSAYGITQNNANKDKCLVGAGPDGDIYVLGFGGYSLSGRIFTKDGKYKRTWWPPASADLDKTTKLGYGVNVTSWGDKVPAVRDKASMLTALGDTRNKSLKEIGKRIFDMAGIVDFQVGLRPANIPASNISLMTDAMFGGQPRLAVDLNTEELYAGRVGVIARFNGKTGEYDPSWKTPGRYGKPDMPWKQYGDTTVGLDGLIYARISEHERYLIRTDHDGKMAPFKDALYPADTSEYGPGKSKYGEGLSERPKGVLISGGLGACNVYMDGLCVAPDGAILLHIQSRMVKGDLSDPKAMRVALCPSNRTGPAAKELGVETLPNDDPPGRKHNGGHFITLWTNEGKLIAQDAVEGKGQGDGAFMDREGNIYAVQAGVMPDGRKTMDGLTVGTAHNGSLIKFRGRGGKYPLGIFHGKLGYYGGSTKPAPADALKMTWGATPIQVSGALWAYYGVPNQAANDCNCEHSRFHLDRFARSWVPATQVCAVMVLDSNGNRIARLGKYGNVDDTEADVKNGNDGLRFVFPRAVAASDTALYAMDFGNRRILKAAISYAVEETVQVP